MKNEIYSKAKKTKEAAKVQEAKKAEMPREIKNLSKLHMLNSKSVSSVRRKYEEKVQGGSMRRLLKKSMRRIDKIFRKGKEKNYR